MSKVAIMIDNCMDCPNHVVLSDPDPHDWFCDDDEKVLCQHGDTERIVTCACRPYQLRKECEIPNWCPRRSGGASHG